MTGPFSSFFDLRDNPFRANPDPRYLFLTRQTKETLDQIIEGIRARKGLLLLTGEVGTGKTVLLNRLMEWLAQERIPKAFIFNSHLKASEVLELILADFGIPFNAEPRNAAGAPPYLAAGSSLRRPDPGIVRGRSARAHAAHARRASHAIESSDAARGACCRSSCAASRNSKKL